MPVNPLTSESVIEAVGGFIPSFAGDYFGTLFGLSSISGKLRFARMAEMALDPNLAPAPDSIIACLKRGLLKPEDAALFLRMHGISLGWKWDNDWLNRCNSAWDAVARLNEPVPSIESAFVLKNRGFITEEQLQAIRKRNAEGSISFAFLRDSSRKYLSEAEALALWNRNIFEDTQLETYLQKIGGYKDADVENMKKLAKVIPPISDIIRFSIRGAFDPEIVRTFGLSDELNRQPAFVAWANAQGLTTTSYTDKAGETFTTDWVEKYWQAHWQYVSPQQLYQMLHRLRPGRMDRFAGIDPAMPPVTMEVVRQALRENDYAPYWRSPLVAINSRQLTRVDVRRAFNIDAIPRQEVTEQYLDLGYIASDAEVLTKVADDQKRQYKLAEQKREYGKWIEGSATTAINAYKSGAIDVNALTNALNAIYDDDNKVGLVVRVTNMQLDIERVRVYVKSVEREFMLGLYGPQQAKAELTQAGVQPNAAQRYIDIWIRRMRYPRRVASTEKIIDWLRRGLISQVDAEARLHNLGWSNTDVLTWMQSAAQDIAKIRARESAAAARSEKQKARAGCDVISCADKAHKAELAEVAKSYPVSTIKKWYSLTIITEEEARQLLQAHELLPFSVDKHLEEWNRENSGG